MSYKSTHTTVIHAAAKVAGITQAEAKAFTKAYFAELTKAALAEGHVRVEDFGTFEMRDYKAVERTGGFGGKQVIPDRKKLCLRCHQKYFI